MSTGKLIIFSAPSGAGKTTLVKHLLQNNPKLAFSISCATRSQRINETDGKDYYFISPDDFKQKIDNQEFVEWEEVYKNHFYGTLKSEIQRIWNQDKHVLFDIDVKGGLNLKKQFGENALAIFVQPPTFEALAQRLTARNTDSNDKLQMRIEKASEELKYAPQFDWILINDDLQKAKSQVIEKVNEFLQEVQ
ncbi:MAG: guanylate kinase [Flavobacteriaceae bacterium]|nr:guanylate kinase [Flavobacteriaceae bacterium]